MTRAVLLLVLVLSVWLVVAQRGTDVRYVHLAFSGDPSAMVVGWFTQVIYGSGKQNMSATGSASEWLVDYGWNHFVTLSDLIPGQEYWYTCGDAQGGFSPKMLFAAAPQPTFSGPFSVGVVGDMGIDYSEKTMQQITQAVRGNKFAWFLHIGDIGYADDHVLDFQYTWNYLFDMIEPVASAMPYMVLPGNHEYSAKNWLFPWTKDFKVYNSRFLMPGKHSGTNTSMYYSFDYGLAHFVCFSTESSFPGALTDADMFGDQLAWIEDDLRKAHENRAQRPWIIVAGHRPMYSSNPTYSENGVPRNEPVISNSKSIQEAFEDLFMKYQVNLVFQGHVHAYERTFPVYRNTPISKSYVNPQAPVYITTGNGGNMEGLVNSWNNPQWSAFTEGEHYGYGILTVHNASHLEWQQFIADDNSLMDRLLIRPVEKALGGPQRPHEVIFPLPAFLETARGAVARDVLCAVHAVLSGADGSFVVLRNFINGEFADAADGNWLENIEPATGQVYGKLPDSSAADIEAAVAAAKAAFPSWSTTPKEDRSRFLYRIADSIEARIDEFAEAESRDNGKPVSLAKAVDIPRAVANFRFFAGAVLHHTDISTLMDNGSVNYVTSQPVGVAGLISPWNLPLYLLTWKIAPAISVGNTCVCKPSEFTSYTAFLMADVCVKVGLPKGVVNIVLGVGPKAGQALLDHPDVPLLSFTGGTVTGNRVASAAAEHYKKVSLELGGKNGTIIFADCDIGKAVETTVRSSFANQGEICLCGERIFVERAIFDSFAEKFVAKVKAWKIGDPREPSTQMGALVSQAHREKILSYIALAKELGGEILCGGEEVVLEGRCKGGYYLSPCVIKGLSATCRVNQEEIFGPVACLIPFDTVDEAIEMTNNTPFGLSSSVFTNNVNVANDVALRLHVGTVWINCWLNRDLRVPFGGVKKSGVGREGGSYSIDFFTEKKTICVQYRS